MEVRLETLQIKVDDDEIGGTMLSPATRLPGVLLVHGWGGSQKQDLERARTAAGLGCICLTFDLRGHESTARQWETVSREQNLRDVMAAYDWFVRRPNVDPASIAVIGISYGGYLATILSALRPVRWLGLRAPALYKDDGWHLPKRQLHADPDLPAFRRRPIHWQDNRALRACADFRGDVLLVESEHDDVVPHPVAVNYVAAFGKARSLTSRVIPEADHGLSEKVWQTTYTEVLMNWLTEMIVGARQKAATSKLERHETEKIRETP
ncbi:MAG: alpha/beta fold hydrolase [Burkholderiales bacterium]|nr:alpha/beta fold hydrolase [Burkholderiales bacterium]